MKAYTWRRVPTSCCRCSLPTVPAPSNSRRATRDARRLEYNNVRRTSTNVQNAVPRSTARRRTITCGMQSADGAPPNTTATRPENPSMSAAVGWPSCTHARVLTHECSRTSVHARALTHECSRTSCDPVRPAPIGSASSAAPWRIPPSWSRLFGADPDRSLYEA
jgi:hypothetical protein